jgi:hypothetical protein
MIYFNSTGSFIMSSCFIKGQVTDSSNTVLIKSTFTISYCDYVDIKCKGTDEGAAIYTEISEGKVLTVEYCTFTHCMQQVKAVVKPGRLWHIHQTHPPMELLEQEHW